MARSVRRLFLVLIPLGLFLLARCTLSTHRPFVQVIVKADRETLVRQFRGPSLSAMDYYAVAVTNMGDTVKAADIGRRSLGCTRLKGQVTFPVTFAQLTGPGVSL